MLMYHGFWLNLVRFIVCSIHLLSALFLLVMAFGLLRFHGKRANTVGVWHPLVSAGVFACFSILHLSALRVLCKGLRKKRQVIVYAPKSASLARISSTRIEVCVDLYTSTFGAYGIFGRHGCLYELRTVLREIVEIPIQSYRAYVISINSNDPRDLMFMSILVAINAVISPLLIRSEKYAVRRFVAVCVDAVFDCIFSVVYPMHMMLGKLSYQTRSFYTTEMKISGISAVRMMFPVSLIDLAMKTFPFLLNCLLLLDLTDGMDETMGNSFELTKKQTATAEDIMSRAVEKVPLIKWLVATSESKVLRWIFRHLSVLWTIGILFLSYRALQRDPCGPQCTMQVYPMFTNTCACTLYFMDCEQLGITDLAGAEEHLQNRSSTLMGLFLHRCTLSQLPRSILRFDRLSVLGSVAGNIKAFGLPKLPPQLIILQLDRSQISEIPAAFQDLPPALASIQLKNAQISDLPDWIETNSRWQSLSLLALQGNQLKKFPKVLLNLPKLQFLRLSHNRISDIPPGITQMVGLQELRLDSNNLSGIPSELAMLPHLQSVYLDHNPIREFPESWKEAPSASWSRFQISGTALCEANPVFLNDTRWCERQCAIGCSRSGSDSFCDLECNNPSCVYDGGDCRDFNRDQSYAN